MTTVGDADLPAVGFVDVVDGLVITRNTTLP